MSLRLAWATVVTSRWPELYAENIQNKKYQFFSPVTVAVNIQPASAEVNVTVVGHLQSIILGSHLSLLVEKPDSNGKV